MWSQMDGFGAQGLTGSGAVCGGFRLSTGLPQVKGAGKYAEDGTFVVTG